MCGNVMNVCVFVCDIACDYRNQSSEKITAEIISLLACDFVSHLVALQTYKDESILDCSLGTTKIKLSSLRQ